MNQRITIIDWDVLVGRLATQRVGKGALLVLLRVLVQYVRDVAYTKSKQWEADSNYWLLHQTGQVAHIEEALNDRFDPIDKRIYLLPAEYKEPLWIGVEAEQATQWLAKDAAEAAPLWVPLEYETGSGMVDFVVVVPDTLVFDQDEMIAVVNRCKRDGKSFVIEV